jgi:hypothetical protein
MARGGEPEEARIVFVLALELTSCGVLADRGTPLKARWLYVFVGK